MDRAALRHPERASREELWSLGLITHESVHVLGTTNEVLTECRAVRHNYRAAKLLGVPDASSKQNALDYYREIYQARGNLGPAPGDRDETRARGRCNLLRVLCVLAAPCSPLKESSQ